MDVFAGPEGAMAACPCPAKVMAVSYPCGCHTQVPFS